MSVPWCSQEPPTISSPSCRFQIPCGFGHSPVQRNSGPCHQSSLCFHWSTEIPLKIISAGFSFDDTCRQTTPCDNSWIFVIRLATYVFLMFGDVAIQLRTIVESLNRKIFLIFLPYACLAILHDLTRTRAAFNSSLGKDIVLSGATLLFVLMRCDCFLTLESSETA